ncbi:SIR2 family protein [Paraburkholderia strydomiana]|uniref:SIR2 family protein n=1 Tax=Paraburkholderia strydomiana TaxID=1245417 RepID=UPI0038BAF880
MATTWGFSVRSFDDTVTQDFLRGILRTEQCVPFIGTGFTAGEKTRGATVPFGAQWMETMRKQILAAETQDKPDQEEIGEYSFQELSDAYFRKEIIPLEVIKETLNKYFTKTDILDPAKKEFLSIPWPYLYTLNIDDGLERAIDGVKVLPNVAFSRHETRRFVYKLHGDADDALTARNREDLKVIFGKADYIKSLKLNHHLLNDLATDFSEKHILFIGCSLTDEIDIAFSLLDGGQAGVQGKNARLYITSKPPSTFKEKTKLQDYGITDVIVCDYSMFYSFAANVISSAKNGHSVSDKFIFEGKAISRSNQTLMRYLVQQGWKHSDDPYGVSIRRFAEKSIKEKLENSPLVVVWGRRFSGKTTLLYRALHENATRRRFFLSSSVSVDDQLMNSILRLRDAIVGIDTDAVRYEHLRLLLRNADRLRENNTTILVAVAKSDLNAFGLDFVDEAVQLSAQFYRNEANDIDKLTSPLGFQRWKMKDRILDNIFAISASPVLETILKGESSLRSRVNESCAAWKENKKSRLEFAILFYLAIRQRIFSKTYRAIAKDYGLDYIADSHLEEFAKQWAPFLEFEETDAVSRREENSHWVLICNSYAWVQYAIRNISESVGIEESASTIVALFSSARKVDSEAFQLILFDNLNSIYEQNVAHKADWRNKVIKLVYEKLASVISQEPDYWLQRAKSVYYISNDEIELRAAVEFCEKGIIERDRKASINANLTKANLLGKLCQITNFSNDEDLTKAIITYADALASRNENPRYIDGLLKRNRYGKGYIRGVCAAAQGRMALLPIRHDLNFVEAYLSNGG